jgi:hypothetical protein
MFGLVNLFISVLKNLTSPSAQSDLALMEMVAGHFAHMEYVTSSELSFPFTREVSALARQTVMGAIARGFTAILPTPVTPSDDSIDTSASPFDNVGSEFPRYDLKLANFPLSFSWTHWTCLVLIWRVGTYFISLHGWRVLPRGIHV